MDLGAGMRFLAGVSALGTVLGAFIRKWSGWRGRGQGNSHPLQGQGRNLVRHRRDQGLWHEAHRDTPLQKHVRQYFPHNL